MKSIILTASSPGMRSIPKGIERSNTYALPSTRESWVASQKELKGNAYCTYRLLICPCSIPKGIESLVHCGWVWARARVASQKELKGEIKKNVTLLQKIRSIPKGIERVNRMSGWEPLPSWVASQKELKGLVPTASSSNTSSM